MDLSKLSDAELLALSKRPPPGPSPLEGVSDEELKSMHAEPEDPTLLSALGTGVTKGLALLPGLPMETAKGIGNLGKAWYGLMKEQYGPPGPTPTPIEHLPGDMETTLGLARDAGIPVDNPLPDDRAARLLHGVGAGLGSAPGGPGAFLRGGMAGGGAALAHEIAPDSPVAPVVGAFAPAATGMAARSAIQGAVPGSGPIKGAMAAFQQAGASPSLGQASGNRAIQGVENILASTPGSSGVMAQRAEAQAADLASGVDTAISGVSRAKGTEVAGRTVKGGVDSFVKNFRTMFKQLDDLVVKRLPPGTMVTPSSASAKLQELTTPIPGAENVSAALVNPKIATIKEAFDADVAANKGAIPYEAIKSLRTKVGSMLDTPALIADIPKGELKQLYKSMSEDMLEAASKAGPEALQAFKRANRFYRVGRERIDNTLQGIINKVDPEDVYAATMSGTKEGASTLRAVKRSIGADNFKVVATTALDRIGRATPGKQNDLGERFSSETFLTNWNKLHPSAKNELLSGYSGAPEVTKALNATAEVASNIREGAKVWSNPSGTSGGLASKAGLYGGAAAVATADPTVLSVIFGGMAAANLSARALTNPTLVGWVAEGIKVPANRIGPHLSRLSAIASGTKDLAVKEDAEEMLRAIKGQLSENQEQKEP